MKNLRFIILGAFFFTIFLFLGLIHLIAEEKSIISIENVHLIDGTGRPPVQSAFLLIEGNLIVKVDDDPIDIPKGAIRIDGKGKYLIPGLMDIHIHLRGGRSYEVVEGKYVKKGPDENAGISALHSYLYCGVTSLYDAGNNGEFIIGLREKERSGQIVSPRIFATGPLCTYPGSHGSSPDAVLIDDWPEGMTKLEKHIALDPDLAKLTYDDHNMIWYDNPAVIPKFPVELMQEVIHYYNIHGVRTTCHIAHEPQALDAIYAGIDTLAHPTINAPVTEGFAKLMAAKKIPMASTLTIVDWPSRLAEHPEFLDQPFYRAVMEPEQIKRLKTEGREEAQKRPVTWWKKGMVPVGLANLRRINEAGGIIALGTDQTIGPAVHREMELLVGGGISTSDVIRMATLNAAIFLGKERKLGSLEPGKLADMVLLNADPTADISNAKKVQMVIKDGKIINLSDLNLPVNQKSASR